MGDRAVVRQRPLVSLTLGVWLALGSLAATPDEPSKGAPQAAPKAGEKAKDKTQSKPKDKTQSKTAQSEAGNKAGSDAQAQPVPIDRKSYKIRAWVVVDPRARLDAQGRETLIARWRALVRRFVGAPWELEVAEGDGPLANDTLDQLGAKAVMPLASGFDKAWMIVVEPATHGYSFSGREFDVLTVRLGPTCRRPAPYPADAPRALLSLSLDLFAPTAEIGAMVGGGVRITVRGASLPASSETGRVVSVGSVFRPIRIFQRPDGSVISIEEIRRSFLRVTEREGSSSRCDIISGLRDPLSRRAARKNVLVALGVKPASIPTRLRYVMDKDKKPAAGFKLIARSVPEALTRDLGMTDREGRISVPPGIDSLVIFRLMAADVEPLDEFPAMPGETLEERTILINPKPQTVALETQLNALRDDLVDLVATRKRLEARLQAREKGQQWDEIEELLKEYRALTPRDEYTARLTKLKDDAAQKQAETKTAILTKTAMALVTDTQALIDRYLDDDFFKAYEAGLTEAKNEAKKAEAKKEIAKASSPEPGAPPTARVPVPATAPTPAPSAAGRPGRSTKQPQPAAPPSGNAVPF